MSADASEANRDDGCEWYFGVPFPSKRAQATAEKERVLKVGDRVRTNGCFTFDPVRGVVVEARDDGVYRVRAEALHAEMGGRDTWTYYASELTLLPPTFTPNTRVRLIRNTQRYAVGDTGTVTVSSDESVGVRMDDGRYWSFKPEDLVVVAEMRGASLAEQADVGSRHDGAVTAKKMLVASLTDLAPDCAGRNGEQACWPAKQEAKPKFKAGDVVLTIGGIGHYYPAGFAFTVADVDGRMVAFFDSKGIKRTRPAEEFVLFTSAANDPAQPCIVIRQVDGQPRPSSWPHVHQSAADATKEAERLASVNPGKQFDVYQRVTGRVAEQHIEMKVA